MNQANHVLHPQMILQGYVLAFIFSLMSLIFFSPTLLAKNYWDHLQRNQTQAASIAIPKDVLAVLHKQGIPLSNIGLYVKKIGVKTPLIDWQAQRNFNPASTMKIVTTYAGLSILGASFRWPTYFYADRKIVGGVLLGDLYIRGTGDPKLIPESLLSIVARFRTKGIKEINGALILDKSFYDDSVYRSKLIDGEASRAYNVSPDPLLYAFNSINLSLNPLKQEFSTQLSPPLSGIRIVNLLKLTSGPCPSGWRKLLQYRTNPQLNGQLALYLEGAYAKACGPQSFHVALMGQDRFFWSGFKAIWEKDSGLIHGGVRNGKHPRLSKLLLTHYSAPLSDTIKDINKFSNNVMARQLFLTLGSQSLTNHASLGKSQTKIRQWLKKTVIASPALLSDLNIENGSGLSRKERISPKLMGQIIEHAMTHQYREIFLQSLPIVGVDGTTRKRLTHSPVRGQAFLKTGTLDDVSSVAGILRNAKGEEYIIVSIINHPYAQNATLAHDKLLEALYEQTSNPSINTQITAHF